MLTIVSSFYFPIYDWIALMLLLFLCFFWWSICNWLALSACSSWSGFFLVVLLIMNFCFRIFVAIVRGYRFCEQCLPFCFIFYFVDVCFFSFSSPYFFFIDAFFWTGSAEVSWFGNFFRIILAAKLDVTVFFTYDLSMINWNLVFLAW